MIYRLFKNTFLFLLIATVSCGNNPGSPDTKIVSNTENAEIAIQGFALPAANRLQAYLPLLRNKRVGIVGNQTSVLTKENITSEEDFVHLVDTLLSRDINVVKVFAPEHGFRGKADAGEKVIDGIDEKTGLPILSLYGSNKKPSTEQLESIDVLVFDIQDVGARFYTYISTLHYVMEAAAENNIPVIVLDRPNPNGHYVDGPVLEPEHQSFVGMHPVPVVYGLTIGEYAKMINGESFLSNGIQADLTVIPMEGYNHELQYKLPIKPSPNLPNTKAVNLYPSLCFFEGTNVNAGRGTSNQFQVYGSPFLDQELYDYSYIPEANEGAKYPKHLGELCHGQNLQDIERLAQINLNWLIKAYQNTERKSEFFNAFFTKLAGTTKLQEQIQSGLSEAEIKASWEEDLEDFRQTREKYLIY